MDGNAMRMRPVDGVPLPAGGMAELQPGGYHVMLIGLKHALKQGEHFPLTLTFEKAGTVTIEVPVLSPGANRALPMGDNPLPDNPRPTAAGLRVVIECVITHSLR